jgi:Stress responsive A/B Barrel Domain
MKILFLAVLFLLTSCTVHVEINHNKSFHHVVIVWLKDPGSPTQRAKLLAVGRDLRRIPGVQSISMGPCVKSNRAIVDSTYDVAFDMTFPNEASMKQYLAHPAHVEAANKTLKPLAKKIVVYDFQAQ